MQFIGRTNESGIYKITNNVNGKLYIGSAVNLNRRFMDHRKRLRSKTHNNQYLQRSWDKYSEKSFIFEILELVQNKDSLIEREQYWLDYFKSYNEEIGYNLAKNALSPMLGKKQSEKFKLAMKKAHVGKRLTDEQKEMISRTHKGKIISEEQILKTKESLQKYWTDEKRAERSNKMKELHLANPHMALNTSKVNRGKTLSKEHIAIIKENKRGSNHHNAKLDENKVREIKRLLAKKVPQKEIASIFNSSVTTISKISTGYRWKHVQF